jgi:N utilization substance protein A
VKITVSDDQLSLAIGKRGQNARLTSKLSGWQVDIIAEEVTKLGFDEKVTQAIEALALIEGISREQADALVHGGLTTLEDLLQAEEEDLSEIEAIGSESGAVLAAARAEAARRTLKVGETSVA